jgi:hypothetical protein
MTLDNGKTIIRLRLNLLIASVIFIIYIFFAYFERFDKQIKFPVLGLSDTASTLILVAIYLLVAIYPMIFKYNYIYFSDDGPSVVLRFYSVGISKGKRKSIEIEKQRFAGYIKKGGLFSSSVALIERVDRREATYPPVSLTALTGKERKKLYSMLERYGSLRR